MKIKNRQQILGLAAGLALALLLGDRLVLSPMIKSWKDRSARLAQLKKDISQGSVLLERQETIRSRWDAMRKHTLPDNISAAENEVLQAFEHWSQVSQISIASMKPQWKRAEDYTTMECRADTFGSIDSIVRFLYNVERDPLALRVEAVEIASRDNDGRQLSLGLQVSGLLLNPQEQ
ncbi:MAG: hypothetical protein L0Y58_03235 [Verrucomicrobia subdivision 3 bacterium]|nr:hypothetical protein [Limisphaerales bacterium]